MEEAADGDGEGRGSIWEDETCIFEMFNQHKIDEKMIEERKMDRDKEEGKIEGN